MNNFYKYNKLSIICLLAIIVMVPTGLFFVLAPIFALICLTFIASTGTNIILSVFNFKKLTIAQILLTLIWIVLLVLFLKAVFDPTFRDVVANFLFETYLKAFPPRYHN